MGIPSVDIRIVSRPGTCNRCGEPVLKFYHEGPAGHPRSGTEVKPTGDKAFLADVCDKCITDEDARKLGYSSGQEMYEEFRARALVAKTTGLFE